MRASHILCVEDDKETQELLRLAFAEEVEEWIEAYDGQQACRILEKKEIDLMLLDIDLPRMRGNEVLQRARKKGMDMAVIVISGNATYSDLIDLVNYDADYFLQKPIDLGQLKEFIKQSLARKRKYSLAGRDHLTSLLNRGSFTANVQKWIEQNRKFIFLVIDVDNFKPINDRYGHLMGDKVLKEVARRLREVLRKSDLIGRYGGDEFVVAVEGEKADMQVVRQKICLAFQEPIEGLEVKVSIGEAFFEGEESFEELFAKADRKMYERKRLKKR